MSPGPRARIGIIANPWSGRGSGERLAESLERFLIARGYSVTRRPSAAHYDGDAIDNFCRAVDAIVAIGGDGTIAKLLSVASRTNCPLYMLPAGNESLFARAFGMRADFAHIEQALRCGSIVNRHFGYVGETPFFLMVSVGFDAMVVELLSRKRNGPVGTRGYLLPTGRTFLSYRPPIFTVKVDGETVVDREAGYFIVANSREYARRLDPVPNASSANPLLQAKFFPNFSRRSVVRSVVAAGLKRPMGVEGRSFAGRQFEIATVPESPVQADGDFAATTPILVRRAESFVPIILPLE